VLKQPFVLWFTGLSGSGKTTLSHAVAEELARSGVKVEQLDGDKIRDLIPTTGFTRADRTEHLKKVAFLARDLESQGRIVVASFISPYEETRSFVRETVRNLVLVHVSTPLEECERRDVKGLYARARRGEIKNFTGIDDPYEPPRNPELEIDTSKVSLDQAVRRVVSYIHRYID
jgi:adenylylsulfate kinase